MKAAVDSYSQRLPNADQVCYGCKSSTDSVFDDKNSDFEYESEEYSNDYYGNPSESDYFGMRRNYRALPEQNVRTDLKINANVEFKGTSDVKVFELMPSESGKATKFVLLEDVKNQGLLYVEYYRIGDGRTVRDTKMAGFSERAVGLQPYAVLYLKYSDDLPDNLKVKMLGFEEGNFWKKPVSFEFELKIKK